MDSSMSPEQRHQSRRKLRQSMATAWCCVKTRQTYDSVSRSLNTCRNVTAISHSSGWKYHSEAMHWLKSHGFPTTSDLTEDQASEWLYEAESRGEPIPDWMWESMPDVDPVGINHLEFTVYTDGSGVHCEIIDHSPPLPDSEVTDFPQVVPDCKTEIVGVMWRPIVFLLDQHRSKPRGHHYDAWLSDCAESLMEADYESLKSLFYCLRDHRKLSPWWKKEFDRRAMKRRVNHRDIGQSSGDVKKSIKSQVYETDLFWYKVPSSEQDPRLIAEHNETPPPERKSKFLRILTKLCFLDDPDNVVKRLNERSPSSQSGYTKYRQQNLYKLIMLRALFDWPTATTTERQRLMHQNMRKNKLYKIGVNDYKTCFPLDNASYSRVKSQVETQITLSTLIFNSPEARAALTSK